MILSTEHGTLSQKIGERRAIELLAQTGFDALDYSFYAFLPAGETLWKGDNYVGYAKELKKIADANGIYFNQAHAPFRFELSEWEDWNKSIIPMIARCFEACAIMGVPHMVIHPVRHLPYNRFGKAGETSADITWKMNVNYFHDLKKYAKAYGVKICLENMFNRDARRGCTIPGMLSAPNEYAEFFELMNDRENFTCCIDTGHAGLAGEDAGDMIRVMGDRVGALHVQDNHFKDDNHLVPFQGDIDWSDVIRALAEVNYQGDLTFEVLHYLYDGCGEELCPVMAKYLHDVGRYLIKKFETYRLEMQEEALR